MHDFDPAQIERQEQRSEQFVNRTFRLRGEEFEFRANVPFSVLEGLSALGENSTGSRFIVAHVEAIKGIIVHTDFVDDGPEDALTAGALERFDRICDPRHEPPVTLEDLVEVANWLIKEAVNRPTVLPSPSQPGPQENGSALTDRSSGEQAEALKA